jgi:glycosyltransferase involved in cell wall biosynthesis
MRIALVLPAQTRTLGGVQRFGEALAQALAARAETECFRVHAPPVEPRTVERRARALARGWLDLGRRHARQPFDGVFTTFHWPWRLLPSVPMVGFVHDLRAFGLAGPGARSRWSSGALVLRAIWRTWDRILVPSSHVARDVARLDPTFEPVVVGEGVDHLDALRSSGRSPARDRLLILGGLAPHKRGNLALAVAARARHVLGCDVVVLGASGSAPATGVRVVERYTDAELATFLEGGRVFVAPSQYEGFGLAVGEAMRFGVPVVYADDCPMQDLVGDGGLGARPNVSAMTEAIERLWERADAAGEQARAQVAGFTWARTAERILAELERASSQP